jgi:hypothetical protein
MRKSVERFSARIPLLKISESTDPAQFAARG